MKEKKIITIALIAGALAFVGVVAYNACIAYLAYSTVNVETGVISQLPSKPEDKVQQNIKIKGRNLLAVSVSGSGEIMAGGEVIDITMLKEMAREFIENRNDDPNLPEKVVTDFNLGDGASWSYPVSQGVISLQSTRETTYDRYLEVKAELTSAFNEIKNVASLDQFGKSYIELNKAEKEMVNKAVPLNISEGN